MKHIAQPVLDLIIFVCPHPRNNES